jgi:malate dehydrogenase (oxaloacetate-decarboxylating)
VFIFPAVGLGVMASRSRRVTDAMMIAAARALSKHSPVFQDQTAALLPPIHSLRDIARDIAFAVGREAQHAGVAPLADSDDEFRQQIADAQWSPAYPSPANH